jgi:hypothetical protein
LFFNFVNNSCFCFPLFPCSDLFGFVLQFWLIVGLIWIWFLFVYWYVVVYVATFSNWKYKTKIT